MPVSGRLAYCRVACFNKALWRCPEINNRQILKKRFSYTRIINHGVFSDLNRNKLNENT